MLFPACINGQANVSLYIASRQHIEKLLCSEGSEPKRNEVDSLQHSNLLLLSPYLCCSIRAWSMGVGVCNGVELCYKDLGFGGSVELVRRSWLQKEAWIWEVMG